MKAISLLFFPAVVQAGTNKTLAPTPGVLRPTPLPTNLSTPVPETPAPSPAADTPFPTNLTPAPQPVATPEPTYVLSTENPTGMSIEYIIDKFSSSKSSKSGSSSSYTDDFAYHFGHSSKSGKGSSKSGKRSSSKGSKSSGKSGKGSKSHGTRHYDGASHGYYRALRKTAL